MPRNQHKWYSVEEKQFHVEKYFKSNLSIDSYANNAGIKRSTLNNWLRQYRTATTAIEGGFEDITPIIKEPLIERDLYQKELIKITTPSGYTIEFESRILSYVLKELKWSI